MPPLSALQDMRTDFSTAALMKKVLNDFIDATDNGVCSGSTFTLGEAAMRVLDGTVKTTSVIPDLSGNKRRPSFKKILFELAQIDPMARVSFSTRTGQRMLPAVLRGESCLSAVQLIQMKVETGDTLKQQACSIDILHAKLEQNNQPLIEHYYATPSVVQCNGPEVSIPVDEVVSLNYGDSSPSESGVVHPVLSNSDAKGILYHLSAYDLTRKILPTVLYGLRDEHLAQLFARCAGGAHFQQEGCFEDFVRKAQGYKNNSIEHHSFIEHHPSEGDLNIERVTGKPIFRDSAAEEIYFTKKNSEPPFFVSRGVELLGTKHARRQIPTENGFYSGIALMTERQQMRDKLSRVLHYGPNVWS